MGDTIRRNLDAVFRSGDAIREYVQHFEEDPEKVLTKCQNWLKAEQQRKEFQTTDLDFTLRKRLKVNKIDWTVQTFRSSFQLYKCLWNKILTLSSYSTDVVVIDPFVDSHTLHRVAITVNAALKQLNIPARIT